VDMKSAIIYLIIFLAVLLQKDSGTFFYVTLPMTIAAPISVSSLIQLQQEFI